MSGDMASGSGLVQGSRREPMPPNVHSETTESVEADDFHNKSSVETPSTPAQHAPIRRQPNSPRFRGVTKHKRTQRYEAHIWESKKQIYLGGFDYEILAAKSHDIMAIRCKGPECDILNYPLSDYQELMPLIERLSREEIITALRNYSKFQTALRTGSTPGTAGSFPVASVRTGAVRRISSMPNRKVTYPPSGRPGHLNLSFPRRRRRRAELTEEEEEEEESDGNDVTYAREDGAAVHVQQYNRGTSLTTPRGTPRRRMGRCPGAIGSPRGSIATPGALPATFQQSMAQLAPVPFAFTGGWSAPSSPHTPHSHMSPHLAPLSSDDVAAYDSVDLNLVLANLADEPSLTYSASDESYLFESVPLDGSHTALEHLCGAAIFQETPSSPETPHAAALSLSEAPSSLLGAGAGAVVVGTGSLVEDMQTFSGYPLPASPAAAHGGIATLSVPTQQPTTGLQSAGPRRLISPFAAAAAPTAEFKAHLYMLGLQ